MMMMMRGRRMEDTDNDDDDGMKIFSDWMMTYKEEALLYKSS